MEIFTGILTLLVLFFIYDYNYCSKALVFYIGEKSLSILKKCSSIERTYRSTLYLIHPFLQDIFIHVFYFYLEKKKEYVNYIICENSNDKRKRNRNNEESEKLLVRLCMLIKRWIYFTSLRLFFFIIEYSNIYENINLHCYINTREVLNNNNFGVVIIDYYLPNATVKKKKKNNKTGKKEQVGLSDINENDIIDLYDLVNIKQEQKIKLILVDKKWKQMLNIKNVESADVHNLYLQDTVLIQYLQFLRIFKNKIFNTSTNIPPNYKDVEILSNILFSSVESENEMSNKMVDYYLKREEEKHGIQTETLEDKPIIENYFDEKKTSTNKQSKEKKNDDFDIRRDKNLDSSKNGGQNKSVENKLRDKLYASFKKCEYKNIKGIIIIVPEIFYNYVNVKEMENNIPIYYFLNKNVKIDSFTVIAKLLGYICVHIHININYGLSIPYLFTSKNINMLDILYNFNSKDNSFVRDYIFPDFSYIDKNANYNKNNNTHIENRQSLFSTTHSNKTNNLFKNDSSADSLNLHNPFITQDNQLSPFKHSYEFGDKSDPKNLIEKNCNNVNSQFNSIDVNFNYNQNFSKQNKGKHISSPLFSCPFSFFTDNYNDINIAMLHFKSIFKNYNFIFLSFNDGTNILLNYFLEKSVKKKLNKSTGKHAKSHFNFHNINPYNCEINRFYKGKYKDNKNSINNINYIGDRKYTHGKINQQNKSDEEKDNTNKQNNKNIMNLLFKDKPKPETVNKNENENNPEPNMKNKNAKDFFKNIKKWKIDKFIYGIKGKGYMQIETAINDGKNEQNNSLLNDPTSDDQASNYISVERESDNSIARIDDLDVGKEEDKGIEINPESVYEDLEWGDEENVESEGNLETESEAKSKLDAPNNEKDDNEEEEVDDNIDASIKDEILSEHKSKLETEIEEEIETAIEAEVEKGRRKKHSYKYNQKSNNKHKKKSKEKKNKKNKIYKLKGPSGKLKKNQKVNYYLNQSDFNMVSKGTRSDQSHDLDLTNISKIDDIDLNISNNMYENYYGQNESKISNAHIVADLNNKENEVGNENLNSVENEVENEIENDVVNEAINEVENSMNSLGDPNVISKGSHKNNSAIGNRTNYRYDIFSRKSRYRSISNRSYNINEMYYKKENQREIGNKIKNEKEKHFTKNNGEDDLRSIINEGGVENLSKISQKFRYSFLKIKNKFQQNLNASENSKKGIEKDKVIKNSFLNIKNSILTEEENKSYSEEGSTYEEEYGKKNKEKKNLQKKICILINFSYNNMFDIFNYPDLFLSENKNIKFSIFHKIIYSLNVFLNSFSILIKQKYFFLCTNKLEKYLKFTLFYNYDYDLFRKNKEMKIHSSIINIITNAHAPPNFRNGCPKHAEQNNSSTTFQKISKPTDQEKYTSNTYLKNDKNSIYKYNDPEFVEKNIGIKKVCPLNHTHLNSSNGDKKNTSFDGSDLKGKPISSTNTSNIENNLTSRVSNNSILQDHCNKENKSDLCSDKNNQNKSSNSTIKIEGEYINEANLLIHKKKYSQYKDICENNPHNYWSQHFQELNKKIDKDNRHGPKDSIMHNNNLYEYENNSNIQKKLNKSIEYYENFKDDVMSYFCTKELYEKWRFFFVNKLCLNSQDRFLFNLLFIYNVYNYLIYLYAYFYFTENKYHDFCANQKFYEFINKINDIKNKKDENVKGYNRNTSDIIPNFLHYKDYKLLKVYYYILQNASNEFISKNIKNIDFPVFFIFSSDYKNFNFKHFDIIKISKNNNIIYLLYKRGNQGYFLSGFKPYIWIHKILFGFTESLFLSSLDN
ncbi:conserved Plasmodium protein, unknown function [Plasmodium vinckei vinckei]|uniref:Uncharacterized protein n=1 Tax=Plasmodium vinckei vinckei TaxID=54757 RepID=A0A449BVC9_PLAVN|nr:conserved Plasmodium protein, unknown function [Plasmodium vinckei vinckei]KEG02579.1 hypothetical protein YYE_02408 [Plasmodium vinckei vinckei]VEV57425.1 conserved Plasmodium protein, unknown function [Plasmodium vinckei vinckei]